MVDVIDAKPGTTEWEGLPLVASDTAQSGDAYDSKTGHFTPPVKPVEPPKPPKSDTDPEVTAAIDNLLSVLSAKGLIP